MLKKTNSTVIMKNIGVAIVVTQLLDIIIHAATNQLEPLRVTSNIIILAWLAIMVSGKFHDKSLLMAVASIAAYFGNPSLSYRSAVPAFLSSALSQNSRLSDPWNTTPSFCDW